MALGDWKQKDADLIPVGVRTKRAEATTDAPLATEHRRGAIEILLAVAAAALQRIPMPEGILIEIVVIERENIRESERETGTRAEMRKLGA